MTKTERIAQILERAAVETLQQSHDDLAHTLTEFVDQMLRGSHLPTPVQWLAVANALQTAAPQMRLSSNPQWSVQVADLITATVSVTSEVTP